MMMVSTRIFKLLLKLFLHIYNMWLVVKFLKIVLNKNGHCLLFDAK